MKRRNWIVLFALMLLLAGAAAHLAGSARVVRGPYLQSLSSDAVVICWDTDKPAGGSVLYRAADGGTNTTVRSLEESSHHAVRLANLLSSTRYRYELVLDDASNDAGKADGSFWTDPDSSSDARPLRIWVIGDSRTDMPSKGPSVTHSSTSTVPIAQTSG